jgi:hypothetical protein
VLLSDPKVAEFIGKEFVPVWEEVRPVPQVTIDFGNGKKLQRTLGGNTVMYLCLPDGRVADVFPGVYTPDAFLPAAQASLAFMRTLQDGSPDGCRPGADAELREWHRKQIALAATSEQRRITMSKAFVESPLLNAIAGNGPWGRRPTLRTAPPGTTQQQALPATAEVTLVPVPGRMSVDASQFQDPKKALEILSRLTDDVSKRPASVEQLKARFAEVPEGQRPTPERLGEMAVQMDSQNNVRLVRPAVHLLFSTYERLPQPALCRDTVYRDILHAPLDDPYLGLADALVPGTPGGS